MDPKTILKNELTTWGCKYRSRFDINHFPKEFLQTLVTLVTAVENNCIPCSIPQIPQGSMNLFARGVIDGCSIQYDVSSCGLSSVGSVAVFARVCGEIFDGYQELAVAFASSVVLEKCLVVYLPEVCSVAPVCAKILSRTTLRTFNADMIAQICMSVLDEEPPPVDIAFDAEWASGLFYVCKVIQTGFLPQEWEDPFWMWIREQRYRYLLDHPQPLSALMITALNQAFPGWRKERLDNSRRFGFSIENIIDFIGVHRRFPRPGESLRGVVLGLKDSAYKDSTTRTLDFFIPGWRNS